MRLPLFPLHTVLFPHLPLPLHIFEPRYRAMVRDLLASETDGGRFVVVRLLEGAETASESGVPVRTDAVGTVAEIRTARRFADGRYALLAVGVERVKLGEVHAGGEYAVVEATPLPEVEGADAVARLPEVQAALDGYLQGVKRFAAAASSAAEMDEILKPITLPPDPLSASYAVAGLVQVDLAHKQQLLECPDAAVRLTVERDLLRRETALLAGAGLSPVAETSLRYHPN